MADHPIEGRGNPARTNAKLDSLVTELEKESNQEIREMVRVAAEYGLDKATLVEYGTAPLVAAMLRDCDAPAEMIANADAKATALRAHASKDFPVSAFLPLSACLYGNMEHYRRGEHLPARLANTALCRGVVLGMLIGRGDPYARKQMASIFARSGAIGKLMRDPKQQAKAEAAELWRQRYAGNHPRLRTNEQFAVECMRRWPVLTSAKVILGWGRVLDFV